MIATVLFLAFFALGLVLGVGYVVIGLAILDALDMERSGATAIAVVVLWPVIGLYILAIRFVTRP